MPKIIISKNKCKGCMLCVQFCPKGSIRMSKDLNERGVSYAEFENGKDCLGCSICAVMCPDCCIEVYKEEDAKR